MKSFWKTSSSMYHGNESESEKERSSEIELSDVERSISLCTLCDEETILPSQRSSMLFSSRGGLIEESPDKSSYQSQSAICLMANECKALDCIIAEDSSNIPPTYLHHRQAYLTFDLSSGGSCELSQTTPLNKHDDVSKSFLELLRKSTNNQDDRYRPKDLLGKASQSLTRKPKKLCNIQDNDVYPPKCNGTTFLNRASDIDKFELSGKMYSKDEQVVNKNFDGIYFSSISEDENRRVGTSRVLVFPSVRVTEENGLTAASRQRDDDNREKSDYINENEDLKDDDEEINAEAPRIYLSGIPDDEIPRKKAKITGQLESRIVPADLNSFQRNRIIGRKTTMHPEEGQEIPRKRSKIVDITEYISQFPHESVTKSEELSSVETLRINGIREEEIIADKLRNTESEKSKFSVVTNGCSPSGRSQAPIASESRQLDVDAVASASTGNWVIFHRAKEINTSRPTSPEKVDKDFQVPRSETEARKLASSENDGSSKRDAESAASSAKPFAAQRHGDDIQLATELAPSENSVILENTKAAFEEIKDSKLAQVNAEGNADLAHIKPSSKLRNKETRVPEGNEAPKEKMEGRNSLESWNEIENAFATSKYKRSLPWKKNKVRPLIAIPSAAPPDVKRLQTKITRQRHSMTNTLKNLRNLSSYMDRVRETIFAEEDSPKEALNSSTVFNINEATVELKRKTMVSTGTQTILKNSPVERPRIAILAHDVGTQTAKDAAMNLMIKRTDTREAKKMDDKMQDSKPVLVKPLKSRKTRKLLHIDRATARAHQAILNATFEEFRCKKRI